MNDEPKDDLKDKDETPHETVFGEFPPGDKGVLAEIDFDLRETGRWLLKVIGGPNNGAEFSMREGESYIIGTDPNAADVIFHDTSVSRQHAKITVSKNNEITLEDLKSRNGTQIDGEPIVGTVPLNTNTLITMGTTSFVIFDRNGEMHTIISPFLPSIVRVLQRGEEEPQEEHEPHEEEPPPSPPEENKAHNALGAFILIGILMALFVVIGYGTATLFQSEEIVKADVDHTADIKELLKPFPSVSFTYNKNNSSLLLIGHVLTSTDKQQILYLLSGVPFIKSIDDKDIIIDENVWREINLVLSKRPQWKAINVYSPKPGKFVISGYLETRSEAEALSNYVTSNFPYTNLLEWNVIVEENILNQIKAELENAGIYNVKVTLQNGEVALTGGVEKNNVATLDGLVQKFKAMQGIRSVKNFVVEAAAEETMVNISNKYQVSGTSRQEGVNVGVVINGRILTKGDILDGMTITEVRSNAVFLEKDGVRYRIDFNQ